MRKNILKKPLKIGLILSFSLFFGSSCLSSSFASKNLESNANAPMGELSYGIQENEIKSIIKKFIEEDFYFLGGKNEFSTVENLDFKKYLTARNEYKAVNSEKSTTKIVDGTRQFDYEFKSINEVNPNLIEANVYVLEKYDYTVIGDNGNLDLVKDSQVGNEYKIFLDNNEGIFKVLSADINVDIDPIDSDYNVNELLGFENNDENNRSKRSILEKTSKIDLAIKDINEKKEKLMNEDYDRDPQGIGMNTYAEKDSIMNLNTNMASRSADNINRGGIYYYASLYWDRRNPIYLNFTSN